MTTTDTRRAARPAAKKAANDRERLLRLFVERGRRGLTDHEGAAELAVLLGHGPGAPDRTTRRRPGHRFGPAAAVAIGARGDGVGRLHRIDQRRSETDQACDASANAAPFREKWVRARGDQAGPRPGLGNLPTLRLGRDDRRCDSQREIDPPRLRRLRVVRCVRRVVWPALQSPRSN